MYRIVHEQYIFVLGEKKKLKKKPLDIKIYLFAKQDHIVFKIANVFGKNSIVRLDRVYETGNLIGSFTLI